MLDIIVVEDEALVAKRLIRFIGAALKEQAHKIRHFDTLDDAEEHLAERSIDLLMLDLNLNGQDGFKLLKSQLCASYNTIVVSANTERAIEAFELGVLDFVAKPFTQQRVGKALERALRNRGTGTGMKNLCIEKKGRLELIALTDIACIRAAGHYSEVVMKDGTEHLHNKSITKLLCVLPVSYRQVHRSYLVELDSIEKIHKHPGSQYELVLDCGLSIPFGRSYYRTLRDTFDKL